MKNVILLCTFLFSVNSYANHCSRSSYLPEKHKQAALDKIALECPATYAQEVLDIIDVRFSSWDTEEYYEITFQGKGYKIIVETESECSGNRGVDIGTFKVIEGCR